MEKLGKERVPLLLVRVGAQLLQLLHDAAGLAARGGDGRAAGRVQARRGGAGQGGPVCRLGDGRVLRAQTSAETPRRARDKGGDRVKMIAGLHHNTQQQEKQMTSFKSL